jgi:hypothetical protein
MMQQPANLFNNPEITQALEVIQRNHEKNKVEVIIINLVDGRQVRVSKEAWLKSDQVTGQLIKRTK